MKKKNLLFILFFTLLSMNTFAQATYDGPEPPPPAPIDNYVGIVAVIATGIAFAFFYKTEKLQKENDINL